jgi:hypothetical protein
MNTGRYGVQILICQADPPLNYSGNERFSTGVQDPSRRCMASLGGVDGTRRGLREGYELVALPHTIAISQI